MAATYTVKQVAQILGYSTNSIYTFLKEKRIKGIRMGKGRFRIPQSELDRLLMIAKGASTVVTMTAPREMPELNPQLLKPVGATVVGPNGVVEPSREGLFNAVYPTSFPTPRVEVPSLFDWFVGIGAIVLGLAMFLFSRTYEEYAIDQFMAWLPAIRILLIAGGFGLLLSDIVGKKFSGWHRVFHLAVLLGFGTYSFILASMFDFEGMVVFGVLTGILLVTFFVAMGGIAGFALYVGLMIALLPVAGVFSPSTSSLMQLVSLIPLPSGMLVVGWFILVLLCAGIVWVGYQRDRRVFWVGMLGVSAILVLLATHYAEMLLWGRALFVLITGLIALFVPVWQSLTFTHKRDRAFIFTAFGSLLVLYIVVVGVLRIMQTNIVDYANRELENKVSYGRMLIESTITSTKTILSSSAQNPLLIQAIEKNDAKSIVDLQKAIFEGNTDIRQVTVTSAAGDVISEYPYQITDGSSYGTRDYFIKAVTTQQVVTSNFFETSADNTKKESVVVVAPIVGSKKTVIGVIMGTVDLLKLGNKLQEIASANRGEYFVVVDNTGKRVIDPDFSRIGTDVQPNDPVRQALAGKSGTGEGYSSEGIRSLVAYDTIDDETNWAVDVQVSIFEVLKETNAAGITVFSVIIISMLMIAMFLLSHRARPVIIEAAPLPNPKPLKEEKAGEVLHTLAGSKKRSLTGGGKRASRDTS